MDGAGLTGLAQIGINAHLLSGREGYRRAGVHRYIAQLLNHLPQREPGFRFTIYTNEEAAVASGRYLSVSATRWPSQRPIPRIMWEQLALPVIARRQRLDLLHGMGFVTPLVSHCPTVVTVFDLSFVHYPDRFPALQRIYLSSQTRRSCRVARRVVAISESGRRDLHELYRVPLERIDVIRPGVDASFTPRSKAEIDAFRRRHKLPSKFILHVGTLQPRKNIPTLVEAFALLRRPDLELVLVGGKGWYFDEIFERVQELSLEGQVRFTGYVPDTELPFWYSAAALLAFPSVYEGFGMPVAQAMACGTPVIAANTSAIPEVVGNAARLFEPQEALSMAEHMATVLDDSALAATMRKAGLLQAQRFSWPSAGQELISVYRRALEEE